MHRTCANTWEGLRGSVALRRARVDAPEEGADRELEKKESGGEGAGGGGVRVNYQLSQGGRLIWLLGGNSILKLIRHKRARTVATGRRRQGRRLRGNEGTSRRYQSTKARGGVGAGAQ